MRSLLALFLILLFAAAGLAAEPKAVSGSVAPDTVWSGDVAVAGPVSVPAGVTLTIAAGAKVRFAAEASLEVSGRLLVQGTSEKPVEFASQNSAPFILRFFHADQPCEVRHLAFRGGRIEALESRILFADVAVEGGEGFSFLNGGQCVMERCRVSGVKTVGIKVTLGAAAVLENCRIERCEGAGIEISQRSSVRVHNSTISDCNVGVGAMVGGGLLDRNLFERNKTAIAVLQSGDALTITENRIVNNESGIQCRQTSFPVIHANTIRKNKDGIFCYSGSSPKITRNLLEENGRAIACVQLCVPAIEKNLIAGNKTGVYLHLSSYAVIHDNNFSGNTLHVELDNMSADWENRAMSKSPRGMRAQNLAMVERGVDKPKDVPDYKPIHDYVDAEGNWWGPDTTREMEAKGDDADIAAIRDYHDVPTRKYEGYEGEYVQDRVRFAKWRTAPVADAGPPKEAQEKSSEKAPEKMPEK